MVDDNDKPSEPGKPDKPADLTPPPSVPIARAAVPVPAPIPGGGGLALGESAAGAGALGLLGAAAVFIVAIVFFVAESYFLAMLLVSFGMLVYVAGAELGNGAGQVHRLVARDDHLGHA